jgi:hypothetical protein
MPPLAYEAELAWLRQSIAACKLEVRRMREHVADRSSEQKTLALNAELAAFRFKGALLHARELMGKAGFKPDQPRWPKGSGDDSGRWSGEAGTGGAAPPSDSRKPLRITVGPRGIGDNKGPALDEPPQAPREQPDNPETRNGWIKGVARWLGRFGGSISFAIGAAYWLYEYDYLIEASLQGPQTFDELREGIGTPSQRGYQDHHIVEQTDARRDGYPESMIGGADNVVRIPTLKHRDITSWYQTKNAEYGGMRPRDYLRGKTWEERRQVGMDALIRTGVLKP